MVYVTLDKDMIELLKNLKFSSLISYEGAKGKCTVYGNLRINTDKGSIELTNLQEIFPFYDAEEEMACLKCKVSDPSVEFIPYCITKHRQYEISGTIKNIEIINDEIEVNDGEYEISFDRAIIFRTDKGVIMFSRDIWFSEVIRISEDDNYDAIYPISDVIEAWFNEGTDKVNVKRTIKKL